MHSSRSRVALDVFVDFLTLILVIEAVRESWNPLVVYLFSYAFLMFW
jgi:hypothetical protein